MLLHLLLSNRLEREICCYNRKWWGWIRETFAGHVSLIVMQTHKSRIPTLFLLSVDFLGNKFCFRFQEAAKRMGISDPTDCLVIEDSGYTGFELVLWCLMVCCISWLIIGMWYRVGVQAAKAAGMNVVAVPSRTESRKVSIADTILHSLLEFQPELWGLPPFEDCMWFTLWNLYLSFGNISLIVRFFCILS